MICLNIQFKTHELEMDFLRRLDPRLRAVIYDMAEFCNRRFKKGVVITCVNRPDDRDSAHGYGRAVDIRTHHLEPKEVAQVVNYLVSVWGGDSSPTGRRTEWGKKQFLRVLYHKGTAWHLHLAVNSAHSRGDYLKGTALTI